GGGGGGGAGWDGGVPAAPTAGASAAVEAAAATVERNARRETGSPVESDAAAIADSPSRATATDARGRDEGSYGNGTSGDDREHGMRAAALAFVIATTACAGRGAREDGDPADLVIAAPLVRTLDPARPLAHVVAIRGERVVAVGEERDVAPLLGPRTRRVELPAGSCLLPGFIDSHAHLFGLGRSLQRL